MAIVSFIHSSDIWTSIVSAGDTGEKDMDPAPKEFML